MVFSEENIFGRIEISSGFSLRSQAAFFSRYDLKREADEGKLFTSDERNELVSFMLHSIKHHYKQIKSTMCHRILHSTTC